PDGEITDDLLACHVPDTGGPAAAGRGQPAAVRAEGHAVDKGHATAVVLAEFLPAGGVPDPAVPVLARRGQAGTVRGERDRGDVKTPQAPLLWTGLARAGVPDRQNAVRAAGGQPPAVRAERHRVDGLLVAHDQRRGRLPGRPGRAGLRLWR